jgi:hypothetical protein
LTKQQTDVFGDVCMRTVTREMFMNPDRDRAASDAYPSGIYASISQTRNQSQMGSEAVVPPSLNSIHSGQADATGPSVVSGGLPPRVDLRRASASAVLQS